VTVTWDPLPPLPPPSRLRLRSVVVLYRVRLRRRWFQELLAIGGIAAGVALLYAASVANSSLSGPVKQLNQGIVGNSQLQLVQRGADGFSDRFYAAVREIPGVRRAAPIVQAQASLVGRGGHRRSLTIYGSDPRIVQLRGPLLQGFSAADLASQQAVAVTTSVADALDLHVGDLARLQIAGRNQTVGIVVLGHRDIGALADTSIALAPLAYLQTLAQLKHRVSRVLVETTPGRTAAVRAQLQRVAAGRLDVRRADYEPHLFDATSRPTAQATMISSTLSALVGFMFAACAMLVTVAARRALAVDLRRSGFTTRQIGVVLLLDAVLLGVCAVLLGLALGDVLSRRGFSADVGFLEGAFPIGNERIVSWSSVAIAAAGGMLAAVVGVLAPMRGALGTASAVPRAATGRGARGVALSPGRLADLSGLVLLTASVAITIAAPGAALVGLIALTVAVVLLLPIVLDAVLVVCRWLSRRVPRTLMAVELALPQLNAPTWRVRSLAIATTGALAVLGGAALQGARANLQAGLDRAATVEYDHAADVWVSPYGPGDLFAVTPIPAMTTERLAAVPGIRRVSPYRGSFLDVAGNRAWVRAPAPDSLRPIPVAQVLHGSGPAATARFRAGGWATLSRVLADALHARVGEPFTLPSPAPMRLRLAAITTNLGWPGGAVILNSADYAQAWASGGVSAYQVMLMPGISPDRGRAAIQQAVGAHSPLRVETATQRDRREMAASRGGLSRLRQISSLMLIAAVIAMAAAMAGLLWQQRSGVARQKLDGHRTTVMWRSLAIESGVLFGTGCLLGAVASLLGQVLFSRGLQTISGFPVIATARPGISAISFALVTAIALLVVAVPGYLVARVRPSLRTGD
jgi:putative ABC transport system permease protein